MTSKPYRSLEGVYRNFTPIMEQNDMETYHSYFNNSNVMCNKNKGYVGIMEKSKLLYYNRVYAGVFRRTMEITMEIAIWGLGRHVWRLF